MGGALEPLVQLTSSESLQQIRQYVDLTPSSSKATRKQSQKPVGIIRLMVLFVCFYGFSMFLLFFMCSIMFLLLPVWFL